MEHPNKAYFGYRTFKRFYFFSLKGGALAQLCVFDLVLSGYPKEKVDFMSFGKPRVGNKIFNDNFKRVVGRKFRVVNKRDIVCRLPPRVLGFEHTTREVFFEHNTNDYVLCDPENGEDEKCSLKYPIPIGVTDHFSYLGESKFIN
jgi:predicted lipase